MRPRRSSCCAGLALAALAHTGAGGCADFDHWGCELATRVTTVTVREHFAHDRELDLLLVVDNSPSMREEQARVITGVAEVIRQVTASLSPRHLGIVTTDVRSPADGGRLRPWPGGRPFATWPPPVGVGPDRHAQALVDAAALVIETAGRAGSDREAGLQAMRLALEPLDTEVEVRNAGFLSPGADLTVLFFTDEDDCSAVSYLGDDGGDAWCQRGAERVDLSTYLEAFTRLEAAGHAVRLGAIIGAASQRETVGQPETAGCMASESAPTTACGCWANAEVGDLSTCEVLSEAGQVCAEPLTCPALCEALGGHRYGQLAEAWSVQPSAAGRPRFALAASICDPPAYWFSPIATFDPPGYCIRLDQPITSPDAVRVDVSGRDPATGLEFQATLPWCDAAGAVGACWDCGAYPTGAWELSTSTEVCLVCGPPVGFLHEVEVTVLLEVEHEC